ncbi:riboflavin biosynthesis protein RibT [Leuconostoc rapi]|uniref:riboflavin biosynthesis protein RibT n=1 Tax=Leuconostoc rapi TaxID=1406906 RepID=UPI00195AD177|nr:riboflavin biosynthesis protein RibT [Leuconostoc rapi]MBM7435816.1 riboflavin biosynthesis RibT protein [Leuconostoc rapi]
MLTQARNDNQKTVMGILSLLPGLRELAHLNAEIAWYNGSDARCLYVWQDGAQVQGVLGVEFLSEDIVLIRHVALTPESRTAANYFAMLSEFQSQNQTAFIMGTLDNQKLINKWRKSTSQPMG